MSEHTKGLLTLDNMNIYCEGGTFPLLGTAAPMTPGVRMDEAIANGRRLAACWNVCDGISTEVLELNATAGGIATLERQRDEAAAISLELLAALEGLVELTKPILNALLLSAGDRDSILLADKINSGHPARHKLIAKAKGGQYATPANLKRAELLAALKLYEAAHSDLFAQCCSNPITNAWGKPVDMTSLNLAHQAASSAIKKVEGGGA